MPLKSVNETKIEAIDYNKEKYFLLVEGYSLLSNIGFVKIDIGFGTSKGVIYYSIRKTCNSKIYSKMRYMKKKVNTSLYEDNHPKISTKGTGFKDKQKAIDTLEIIAILAYTPQSGY